MISNKLILNIFIHYLLCVCMCMDVYIMLKICIEKLMENENRSNITIL